MDMKFKCLYSGRNKNTQLNHTWALWKLDLSVFDIILWTCVHNNSHDKQMQNSSTPLLSLFLVSSVFVQFSFDSEVD